MKKLFRIVALILVFCLCFSTVAFAAEVDNETDTAATGEPDGTWSRICRQMPFAPGHEFQLLTLDDLAWKSGEYSGTPLTEKVPSQMPHFDNPEELPLLIIVIGFNNIDYDKNFDWGETIFSGEDSLAQYYKDMSFNQFSFVPAKETSKYGTGGNTNTKDKANDGVVHVKLDANHADWYVEDYLDEYVEDLIAAIWKADEYVDFASFDKNHDGELTTDEIALGVVVAGYEGAYGTYSQYGASNYLWSFAWNLTSGWWEYGTGDLEDFLPSPDGVYVDSYITIAEQLKPGVQEPISVLAHELGHYLGLPDLYDTYYAHMYNYSLSQYPWRDYDVDYMSVMCSGSWGWNGSEYIPGAFDAWSRCVLGWVEPTVVTEGVYDVVSDQGTYNVLQVETGVSGEYYLLENREYTDWDVVLYYTDYSDYADNGGLVAWHIDDKAYNQYAGNNAVNNTNHRPSVMPLYPEYTSNKVTFIGTLDYNKSIPRPFFTYDIWQDYYQPTLGDYLNFPVYNGAAKPANRQYSDVEMKILDNNKPHTVTVQFGEDLNIERIAGKNRYKTAIEAANAYLTKTGKSKFDNVIIASGSDYADALAGSYLAASIDAPILLVSTSVETELFDYIKANTYAGGNVYLLGGKKAVSEEFEGTLEAAGFDVERLGGKNRFDTNMSILNAAGYNNEDLLVCYGMNYADSLSASAVGQPILLVGTSLTGNQKEFLAENGGQFDKVYVIGGTSVVSDNLAQEVADYVDNSFTRVSGKNRFLTSVAVAKKFFPSTLEKVYLAYAMNFPDGLAGGPLAYIEGAPMLLVTDENCSDAVAYATGAGVTGVTIMGGKTLISDSTGRAMLGK